MTYEETLHYLYTSIPVFQNAGPYEGRQMVVKEALPRN